MDKDDDFKFNLARIREGIKANYIEKDEELRNRETYSNRITRENNAISIQYLQLNMRRTSPMYKQPTLKDYENVADSHLSMKDKLEADIKADIKRDFEERDVVNFHINLYFEDDPARAARAKEHIDHEGRAAFNEAGRKPLYQSFIHQISEEVRKERDEKLLQQSFDSVSKEQSIEKEEEPSSKAVSKEEGNEIDADQVEIPELEVHDFDTSEVGLNQHEDHYPSYLDNYPTEGEPLDFSKDNSSPSQSKDNSKSEPDITD
jgi:hypothetical protein